MPKKQTHIQNSGNRKRQSHPNFTPEGVKLTVEHLDLSIKQSIVDLLFAVEAGYVSKGRAAEEVRRRFEYSLKARKAGPSGSSGS